MPNSRWSRIGNAAQASIGVFMVFRGVYTPFKIPLIICISNHLPHSSVYQEKVISLYSLYLHEYKNVHIITNSVNVILVFPIFVSSIKQITLYSCLLMP